MKYFKGRSEPVLRKMLVLIAGRVTRGLISNPKKSNFYALLMDELTDIWNMCQLVSFVKFFDVDRGNVETVFLDCSNHSEYSLDASPDADAIITRLNKTF